MANKDDLKRLLKNGLTGLEAASLMVGDALECDHKREGFLSEADAQRIKASLKSDADKAEYDKWIRVFQLLNETCKEGQILILKAQNRLETGIRELERYSLEDRIRRILMFVPAIVTEKQYQDLYAKQRERKLKELHTLRFCLSEVALGLTSEAIQQDWMAGDEEGLSFGDLIDYLEDIGSDLYGQSIRQFLQLVRDGKLKPVLLQKKDIKRLKDLEAEAARQRIKDKEDIGEETHDVWGSIVRRERQLKEASYQAAEDSQKQEILLSRLEKLLAGTLAEEEAERLLDFSFCTGAELYQLGLASQAEWMDVYQPNLDEESGARPAGAMQSMKLAIIKDPRPEDLDERGYYKDSGLESLSQLSGYEAMHSGRKVDIPAGLMVISNLASAEIKSSLAIQAVGEAVSQILGVKLTEDLEKQYEELSYTIGLWNEFVTVQPPHYLGQPVLSELKIGKLKATAKSIQFYRGRMALILGGDWWKEALASLDFQTDDAGSLAQEIQGDIKSAAEQMKAAEDVW